MRWHGRPYSPHTDLGWWETWTSNQAIVAFVRRNSVKEGGSATPIPLQDPVHMGFNLYESNVYSKL